MFNNVLEELHYVSDVKDSKERTFVLHILRCVANNGPLSGFFCYDFYLSDQNPEHDILVGIGHKAFAPDEFNSEEERLNSMQELLAGFIEENADKAFEILNS